MTEPELTIIIPNGATGNTAGRRQLGKRWKDLQPIICQVHTALRLGSAHPLRAEEFLLSQVDLPGFD